MQGDLTEVTTEPCKKKKSPLLILWYIDASLFGVLGNLSISHSKLGALHTVSWTNFTGEKNLIEITDYLFELDKTHIYHLGLVLGLSRHRVKEMEDSKTFLDDMIAAWLKKVDQVGVPTWQKLVEALKHWRLGQIGIASEIEKDKLHNLE